MVTIHWRDGDYGTVRVWLDGWPDDMFEVLTKREFATVERLSPRFFKLEEHID